MKQKHVIRNFQQEARDLIKSLKPSKLYALYEVVSNQLKRPNSDEREKELRAVKSVIEKTNGLDPFRLQRIWEGYRSEMASTGNPKDGQYKQNKKKV